ncbi:MAG TPA: class I SAM-dependent methyltransferase [Bryobacteraceae bacterium]|nr:class I SAM-dependent methyltransferase [Bryobacteraceae bacterium]
MSLLSNRLKGFWRGPGSSVEAASPANGGGVPQRPAPRPGRKEELEVRQSRGLEQFFGSFRGQAGLSILDLGGASQENINFITSLGHKFYSEDFLRIFQETFGDDVADQSNPGRIDYFLRQSLEYTDEQFDGVLAWDVLEYMEPALLSATADRLLRVMKPQGYLLAFFRSDDREKTAPYYIFRIQDLRTLQISQHGERALPSQLFNNRRLEKLFQKFQTFKFFLTRDRLREVIVRK